MEPDAKLPAELEHGERRSVIPDNGVIRGVSRASNLSEQLRNFARQDTLVLQSTNQVVLSLFARREQADLGCQELSEKLGELTQLQESGVRILREVPLGKHSQTNELLVVLLELREVCLRGAHPHAVHWFVPSKTCASNTAVATLLQPTATTRQEEFAQMRSPDSPQAGICDGIRRTALGGTNG